MSQIFEELRRNLTARGAYGCIDTHESVPGAYSANLTTRSGEQYKGTVWPVTDAQSGSITSLPSHDSNSAGSELWAGKNSKADLWKLVRDESVATQRRLEAIHELLDTDREAAIVHVAEELAREAAPEDWRNALVFLAEDVHFPTEHRQIVKDSLLRIAHSLRKSNKTGADRVVWSAIRRASSLLTPLEVNLLVPFLEREGVVDARSVALRCVEKLFLPAPPVDPESVRRVGDRAHVLASKLLDPDVFRAGEDALLALSAVCALAAIGDTRLGDVLGLAANLNRRWLKLQLRTRLETLRNSWYLKDSDIATSSAFGNLKNELVKLG